MNQKEIQLSVKKIFSTFLEKNNQRKTTERITILECIYKQTEHFTADSLYQKVKTLSGKISRATVYNTIELLLTSNLITKHQFGKAIAQYERSYQTKQHDHLICEDCEKVFEFCDPRVQQIKQTTEEFLNLKISHHALYFYGRCQNWQEDGTCEHKK